MSDLTYKFEKHDLEGRGLRFIWSLKGDKGGVHLWAQFRPNFERCSITNELCYGGIEIHSPKPRYEWEDENTPAHKCCWLLEGPCWHDGSSLAFDAWREIIEANIEDPEDISEIVNCELLSWYKSNFDPYAGDS